MDFKKIVTKLSSIATVAILVAGFTLNAPLVSANSGLKLNDDFNKLYLKPNHKANWWIINWGNDGHGAQTRVEDFCGTSSCINAVKDHGDKFVRLTDLVSPGGAYINADLAEIHTGFPAEGTGQWTPRNGHPVTLETRVKWSNNYKADGSGGAVGSSGIWLWNSPFDLANYDPNAVTSGIGFNWTNQTALGGYIVGLKAVAIKDNFPVFIGHPTLPLNINDWVCIKIVWSEDASGTQTASYWMNDQFLGTTTLPQRLTNLSVETWNDNTDAQLTSTGGVVVNYAAVPAKQDFDVGFITVTQK